MFTVFCNFDISFFGFEGKTLVQIAPDPGHILPFLLLFLQHIQNRNVISTYGAIAKSFVLNQSFYLYRCTIYQRNSELE